MATQTVTDLSNWAPPQRRRPDGDGGIIVEKLSPIAGLRMVDPQGNDIGGASDDGRRQWGLPLHTGMANRSPNDPYRTQVLAEKIAGGWVQYGKCPLGVSESVEHLPQSIRYELDGAGKPIPTRPRAPCQAGVNGGKIHAANPCACIPALIKARQERHAKKDAANEERTNKLAKLTERTAEANLSATTQLAEAAKAMAAAAASQVAANNQKGGGK